MDHTISAKTTTTTWSGILLTLVIASLACAPISWVVDGVTPSYIVYPAALLIGLRRRSQGTGTLYFGVAGTIRYAARTSDRRPCRATEGP